mgnify:CR=1 FL=1
MNIEVSNELKKSFSDFRSLQRKYGDRADRIRTVFSILQEASCLCDVPNVPPTRRHKLQGNGKLWALDITKNYRMIIRAIDGDAPEEISAISIECIVDYH